jgi:hypothetical protein
MAEANTVSKNIADIIGILGGVTGLVALAVQGYTMWQNRRPKLVMFISNVLIGYLNKQPNLIVLIRLANTSTRPAFMYLDTLYAEVLCNGRWHPAPALIFPPGAKMNFDLPAESQQRSGVHAIKPLEIFEDALITLDHPYSRLIPLNPQGVSHLEKVTRLRIKLKDSSLHEHQVEADFPLHRKAN